MKKLLIISILLCGAYLTKAQITNKCFLFGNQETINFSHIAELDNCLQNTIQLWVNLDQWNENSCLFSQANSAGELLSAQLGKEFDNRLNVFNNGSHIGFSKLPLLKNKWHQLTFVLDIKPDINCRLFVDGKEFAASAKEKTKEGTKAQSSNFILGGGFTGRMDEIRIWNKALLPENFNLNNTTNHYHADYANLIAYWKGDQQMGTKVFDTQQKYHSLASSVKSVIVTDNSSFKYRLVSGYTTFSSFFSRPVERETYLMTNDLLVLSGNTNAKGDVTFGPNDDSGKTENVVFLPSFNGKKGVLAFDGKKSVLKLPNNTIALSTEFSFGCWIFIDKWKNGAMLIQKNTNPIDQFYIQLSDPKTLVLNINGKIIKTKELLKTNAWQYVSVAAKFNQTKNTEEICFNVLSENNEIKTDEFSISMDKAPTLSSEAESSIGEGFCGKMDEISYWKSSRKNLFINDAQEISMADIGKPLTTDNLGKCIAYWKCDDPKHLGSDSYSWPNLIKILRSAYNGYTGYTVRASFSGGEDKSWEGMVKNEESRKQFGSGIAQLLQSPLLDGVDLDFEWCYDDTCWIDYGKAIDEVRKLMPKGKIFTVTPHVVAYKLPAEAISDIDFALFQNYGPSPDRFTFDDYTQSLESFRKQGYPDQKIILSTSTTTSKGISATGDIKRPTAYKNLINSGSVVSKDAVSGTLDGYTYWINSVEQTRKRAKYVVDNNLAGIMFWDIGCDVSPENELSIIRAINSEISSNLGLKIYE